MAALAALHAVVHGVVQGVFFRDFTSHQAGNLSLTGYVRNLPDGTVEVMAEGERQSLEALLQKLKTGPPAARVSRVASQWLPYTGGFADFSVRF